MNGERLAIYCADIGSIRNDNFGWAVVHGDRQRGAKEIGKLVDDVVGSLAAGVKVAVGVEGPLSSPRHRQAEGCGVAARVGDRGGRSRPERLRLQSDGGPSVPARRRPRGRAGIRLTGSCATPCGRRSGTLLISLSTSGSPPDTVVRFRL